MNYNKIIGISQDFKYIFTDKFMTTINHDRNDLNGRNQIPYTLEHINLAVKILKENTEFNYKQNKISITEYSSEPRKFLNFLIGTIKPKNSISLLKEWEINYGNKLLINESYDSLLIESKVNLSWSGIEGIINEQFVDWVSDKAKKVGDWAKDKAKTASDWTKSQVKQIKDKGVVDWAKDKAGKVWSYVKDKIASAWNCVKSGVECIMEGMRELVFGAVGSAVLTGVAMIPVIGQVTTGIIFGSLLIWDIYLGLSGKGWNIMNIVMDCVGALMPALGKIIKTAFVGIKTFAQLGAAAVSKGGIFLKVFNLIKTGVQSLKNLIGKSAAWLGEKLGLKSLQNWGTKAQQKIGGFADEMSNGANQTKNISKPKTQTFKKEVNKIWSKKTPMPTNGVLVKSMGNTFMFTVAMCTALGLDSFSCKQKIENNEISEADMIKAKEAAEKQLEAGFKESGFEFTDL